MYAIADRLSGIGNLICLVLKGLAKGIQSHLGPCVRVAWRDSPMVGFSPSLHHGQRSADRSLLLKGSTGALMHEMQAMTLTMNVLIG